MGKHGSFGSGAVPNAVRNTRDEIAAALQAATGSARATGAARGRRGTGNVQGVAIGLGDSATGMSPVVTVYTAAPVAAGDARAMVVDGLGARSAADAPLRFVTSGVIRARGNTRRVRPAPGGFSIGHPDVTAGTLGCLAKGRSAPRRDNVLCLSNNHVIANTNDARLGDPIYQPGPADGGGPADKIAVLERFIPLRFDLATPNRVDCATGLCDPKAVTPKMGYEAGEDIEYFEIGDQPIPASLGMLVGKSGRTTGLTRGVVTGLDWSGVVDYDDDRIAFFEDQIVITGIDGDPFSAGGDSGSVIWRWDEKRNVAGLLFAGTSPSDDDDDDVDEPSDITLANPISAVLDALDINLYTGA
ncbi:hypothetical protein E1200_06725 [Actinomadura sp. GC306]|uniref:hypothetical protein n=1 Tax=Actinomadura sp. GC306 TaxID=2530367 RepID=UPI0010478448|nr:hypothetical protein [Actinomadura sp. GC306]TDC69984.1 hypothetical protein E1200_06725 [Actinomadura sp. GC306]